MHILMIAPEQIPVPGGGSVEICMLAIAKRLARRHRVTIVSRVSGRLPRKSRFGNLTIVRVGTGSHKTYIASVLSYIRGRHYDAIQVDNRPYYMAKVKRLFPHTPVSLFLHSLTFVPRSRSIASSLKSANLIIANSSSLKSNLRGMFPGVAHKIRMVHLGVDASRFKPASGSYRAAGKRRYGLGKSFTVLFAGRVIPRKGVPVLIRAVSKVRRHIPGAKLVVAGSAKPGYLGQLRAQARRYGVPMKYVGRIPHSRIHRLYRMADCFVCPSQKHEAFGLVNVEAMASGVPVVASNIGGIREIVRHARNGYLVNQYRSSDTFAHYIVKIARSRALAKRLGAEGRRTVLRRFSWSSTAARLVSLYRRR
ncbi:glycosyltransferase family 4 protein [Paenibacillus cremeus]|uniref:Glycosyltransferase family 4 protein n=1 Tax=Paenibacillus cremeus TaxID=2163881 RepID=A0A559KBJ2_9BACL|nr:glycosyltransferase family 4 protein [Paenibacillus cremeus]TVY09498.1 glycosyltransferase family 4 protein [Paenibacillus cremeus]